MSLRYSNKLHQILSVQRNYARIEIPPPKIEKLNKIKSHRVNKI